MPVAHSFHHALAAPRSQCRFHLFLQNHFDHFPHPLPYRRLQPLPQRSLLALFHCNASLRHGVFLLCPEPPLKRFRDFSFNYFSGEYAFLFFYRNRDRTLDSAPDDWTAFSPPITEDPAAFLAEVDRILQSVAVASHYQLLGVEPRASHNEVKRNFYQLARRFHPDHHMDHPEWTPRLLALMDTLATAYRTLSDDETKKQYDSSLTRVVEAKPTNPGQMAQGYLDKAMECMAEKNFSGCILWLHRTIEYEPSCSNHRAMLGRCLSAIPEYHREAIEQFELAIDLDPRNVTAHLHYGELLEQLRAPWKAKFHYARALEVDPNNREARDRLTRLGVGMPRSSSRLSLLGRLTGRR